MNKPAISLVTTVDEAIDEVRAKAFELKELVDNNECVGIAFVVLSRDGRSFVGRYGRGNRVRLLGAVTDLQYTIAKDGDG